MSKSKTHPGTPGAMHTGTAVETVSDHGASPSQTSQSSDVTQASVPQTEAPAPAPAPETPTQAQPSAEALARARELVALADAQVNGSDVPAPEATKLDKSQFGEAYARALPVGTVQVIRLTDSSKGVKAGTIKDFSPYSGALYFLSTAKDSKFIAQRSLPALVAMGLKSTPNVVIAFNYASDTHKGIYAGTLAEAFDKCACSQEIIDQVDAILKRHTLADSAFAENKAIAKGGKTPAKPSVTDDGFADD